MKSIKRTLLGLVTSLLLSAGFATAAEFTDALTPSGAETRAHDETAAPNCGQICHWNSK